MDEPKVRRTLYGGSSSNTCAFCAFHKRALTPKQMKKHKCLAKGCTALVRAEHPLWVEREQRREVRKARKQRMEQAYIRAVGGETDAVYTQSASAESH